MSQEAKESKQDVKARLGVLANGWGEKAVHELGPYEDIVDWKTISRFNQFLDGLHRKAEYGDEDLFRQSQARANAWLQQTLDNLKAQHPEKSAEPSSFVELFLTLL